MFKGKEDLDLINGSVGRTLLHLSIPIIILNLLRTVYNLTDAFWVGRLSSDALAAIGFGFPFVLIFMSVGMGISVAGSVLVAQHEGNSNRRMVNLSASQLLSFNLLISIILGTAGFLVADGLLGFYGASETVHNLAVEYLRIIFMGIFFMFGFGAFIALLRGFGDTKTPMFIMVFSIALNVVLDPALIFGWGPFPAMGIEGAALATIFSRGVGFVVGFAMLLKGWKGLKVSLSKMIPDMSFFKKIIRLGGPALIGTTGRSISINFIVAFVGIFPDYVMAGHTVGIRIISAIFLTAMAVGRGVTTMTGQNLGADRFDRAREVPIVGAKYTFLFYTILGVAVFALSVPLISAFTSDPQALDIGVEFLMYVSLSLGFIGIWQSFAGGIRGAGKTHIAALILVIPMAFVRLPLAYFLSGPMGPTGIWLAFPISNVFGAVLAYLWFRRGTWVQKLV